SWYMSAGGTFIVVEIVNQSACDDFLHKFFPETNTPNIPAGEYRDVCNGRKTFWVRPKSRLVQIFGSLIYCTDDLYEWDRLDGVSKRASVTGDFLIVSMPEGQLATRFREEILMHIHFRSNWRIKIKQFYDGTLRLFYKYFGLGNYFFSRWVRNNFVSVFIKICYEIESEINSLVDVEEILKKPIVGSHSTIIEIRKLKLSRQLKFVSNELPYFSFTVSVWNQHDAVDYDISAVGIRGAYIPLCLRYTETVRTIHLTSFYGEKMTEETSTFVNILEKDYSFIVYRHGF
ncbi:hypothetical protein, partial [Umezakia ovalisporum]|uniref:hypothetical protein n=1 Tax=Umezakia ovalisporum TaxID=75695 RepID=UPI0039C5E7CF